MLYTPSLRSSLILISQSKADRKKMLYRNLRWETNKLTVFVEYLEGNLALNSLAQERTSKGAVWHVNNTNLNSHIPKDHPWVV